MRGGEFLTFPEMRERLHYVAWLAFSLLSFPLAGHAAVLVLSISLGEYVEAHRLLAVLLAALVLAPLAYGWRKYGERHCRFLELDEVLDRCLQRTSSTPHLATIEALIAEIDTASGMERQLARNQAKAWLQAHAGELGEEERELVAEHLGYLIRAQ
jgi:hypothetical protein